MVIANDKPIRIIGYRESSMTFEFVNAIEQSHAVEVLTPSEFLDLADKNQYQYIVCFFLNRPERKQIIDYVDSHDLDLITVISDQALLGKNPSPVIQPGTFIFPFSNISLSSNIGRHCIIGSYSLIGHFTKLGNNCMLAPGVMITGKSSVGNNCVLQMRSSVTNKITVGDNVELLAFSSAIKNITEPGQYIGTPARRVIHHDN